MSKIFQILDNMCFYEMTDIVPNLEYASSHYAPETFFVIAPDYVSEGWGYDDTKNGDEKFVKPKPPEGWELDDETGKFYIPNSGEKQVDQLTLLQAQLKASVERQEFLEDCIAEMAMQVYSGG